MSSDIPKSPENKQNPSAPQAIDNARMQMILSLNPAVIYACRPDGDYGATDISANIKEQLGYEPADFIENPGFWASRLHPEDVLQIFEDLPKIFKTGRHSHEYRFLHKNGEYRWMRDECRLVIGAAGKPVEIVGSWTDITERKQLEEQHHELEKQLQQTHKMHAIGQLAGGIAHDFNNQLSGILGFANLLRNKLTDEKHQRHLQNIMQSAQRAATLTRQLLAFSRRGKYLLKPTDIQSVVHDVATILEHSIDKNIQLNIHCNTARTVVLGDPSQLQNALLNIALNARDAIKGAGEIDFSMESVELNQADCDKTSFDVRPGRFLKIGLRDNGCGMDEQLQSRIFEPFFTTKETGEGTGMGLASVYGTITGHQGMIHVISKLGEGTSFCIFLPLSEEALEESNSTASAPICGKANILVVDDEEGVRMVSAEMLEDLGYTVKVCAHGQEAIEYYRQYWQQVDLTILDMMMPGLSGKETFLALQEINPRVRTVLLSGFSLNEQIQELLDLGAISYQGKPFEQAELSRTVAEALKTKSG